MPNSAGSWCTSSMLHGEGLGRSVGRGKHGAGMHAHQLWELVNELKSAW